MKIIYLILGKKVIINFDYFKNKKNITNNIKSLDNDIRLRIISTL